MTIKVIWHVAITSLICTATTTSNNNQQQHKQQAKTRNQNTKQLLRRIAWGRGRKRR